MKKLEQYYNKYFFNLLEDRKKYNKSHLEFSKKISTIVQEICEPLSYFGITMFTYSRLFDGGRRLYICSNKDWVEYYVTQEFQDEIDHLAHYVPPDGVQYALWSGFKNDKVFDAVAKHDMGNGFTIYEKNKEYVDYFDFSSHKDNTQIVNLYMNNIPLLLRFIEYFKEKIFLLIDFKDKKNLLVPKNFILFDQIVREENFKVEQTKELLDFDKKQEKKMHTCSTDILSRRELDCLRLISDGKTIKEASRDLNLSPRTVSSYIDICKMKLQVYRESDMIILYKQKFKSI